MNTIFWFRRDLRLADNPGLIQAAKEGTVLPIYIWPPVMHDQFKIGNASRVYLHYSLKNLNESLDNSLNFYKGDPKKIIIDLVKKHKITTVFCSRIYEPSQVAQDAEIEKILRDLNVTFSSFNGSYLWEPEKIKNEQGSYYKVFTAYKRKVCLSEPRKSFAKPKHLAVIKDAQSVALDDLHLISSHEWEKKIHHYWSFGERNALEKLESFVNSGLAGYKTARDYPARENTSKLSVNLHFGEISPYQVLDAISHAHSRRFDAQDLDQFISELIWREFSCYLITHFKGLASDNFHSKFDNFPWKSDEDLLNAWKKGKTGYPIVDAGMRQLRETGYMHNRVRMIVASFLVKNLMIHWHAGRDWFWECLVDADLANNSASWQWVAGCGADAAPYFRIFSPTLQGEKFDSDGSYTRKFVPELKLLPDKYLFKPWTAPRDVLKSAGIVLGRDYPTPIVDLSQSRDRALAAYKDL